MKTTSFRHNVLLCLFTIGLFIVSCSAVSAAEDSDSIKNEGCLYHESEYLTAYAKYNDAVPYDASTVKSSNNRTIQDGDYEIAASVDSEKVVDVEGKKSTDCTNVQLESRDGTDSQKYHFSYHNDDGGYYTIRNIKSGKMLDVACGNTNNGANVWLYAANGTRAQRWAVILLQNGLYSIRSLLSGKMLDINAGSTRNGSNIQVYESNGTAAQKFFLIGRNGSNPANKTVTDGEYIITASGDGFRAVDVAAGSEENCANVQLYDANGSNAQRFNFRYHYDNGGYYVITNAATGKALDVSNASLSNGANVWMYTANGTPAQRWAVILMQNGLYSIKSLLSGKMMDISAGLTQNGSNIRVYESNGPAAQKFNLIKAKGNLDIQEGVYTIHSAANYSKVVDLYCADTKDGTNIQLYRSNGTDAQKYIVQRCSDGYYRIVSCASGKVLDLACGSMLSGANLQAYTNNNTLAQRWLIYNLGDGTIYIRSVKSDNVIGLSGGHTVDGTNIGLYAPSGLVSQKFILKNAYYKPVSDGSYVISCNADKGKAVDISNADRRQNVNVQLYSSNGTDAQKFKIVQGNDGFYTIINVNSRHALTVADDSMNDGGNIAQYAAKGSWGQKWLIIKNTDGSLSFISALSSKAFDVAGGILKDTANIRQYAYNGSDAQKFVLFVTTYDKSLDSRPINNEIYIANTFSSLLDIARSQIGIKTGEKYWKYYVGSNFVNGTATPWCGCFVAWCFNQAGLSGKISGVTNKAYVPSYRSWGRSSGRITYTPSPGDIVLFGSSGGSHVGIVESVSGNTIYTIEGNTGRSYNGEVKRNCHNRYGGWVHFFLHWQ